MASETMTVSGVSDLSNGKPDVVSMLYSDNDLYQYPTYPSDDQDAYGIAVQYNQTYYERGATTVDVPMLVPYGLSGPMGLSAGDRIRWLTHNTQGAEDTNTYMGTVRGMLTKLPGFAFSALNTIVAANQALISLDAFEAFAQDLYARNSTYEQNVRDATKKFQFKNDIPKSALYVKLTPGISRAQRVVVSNGLRSYFLTQATQMVDRQDLLDAVGIVAALFSIFVGCTAGAALFINFFVVLIGSQENVTDATWEYGVLRAMGLTKGEGLRIFLYEQYAVVISAALLGAVSGILTAAAVAVQFYSFVELPIVIEVPWILFACILAVALLTVLGAVCAAVMDLNRQQAAALLKG